MYWADARYPFTRQVWTFCSPVPRQNGEDGATGRKLLKLVFDPHVMSSNLSLCLYHMVGGTIFLDYVSASCWVI